MKDEYTIELEKVLEETQEKVTEWINKYSDLEEKYFKLQLELSTNKMVKIADLRKEIQKLKNENKIQKLRNERGAGRKPRFSDAEIETIRMYRLQGKTIKEISSLFDCSVGLIHKLINEKQ